jgi:DNA mismatch endonuclease (patch repair protein)
MAAIRGRDTGPEMALRRQVWKLGGRYRIHNRAVLGTPDLSNATRKVAVFVDGCFWHGCPLHYRRPSRNLRYWDGKLKRNLLRRAKVRAGLEPTGWHVVELWECEVLADPATHSQRVAALLGGIKSKNRA